MFDGVLEVRLCTRCLLRGRGLPRWAPNVFGWLPLHFARVLEKANLSLVIGHAVGATNACHVGASSTLWMEDAQQVINLAVSNYGCLGIYGMTVKVKGIVLAAYGGVTQYFYSAARVFNMESSHGCRSGVVEHPSSLHFARVTVKLTD
jgi:hypothetical protein